MRRHHLCLSSSLTGGRLQVLRFLLQSVDFRSDTIAPTPVTPAVETDFLPEDASLSPVSGVVIEHSCHMTAPHRWDRNSCHQRNLEDFTFFKVLFFLLLFFLLFLMRFLVVFLP